MGSREDDEYWNLKYADPPFCSIHEDEEMSWDKEGGEWWCWACDFDDETSREYYRG